MPRRDIELRNRLIIKLYARGIGRKQIPAYLDWKPLMTYEAVKKVLLRWRRPSVRNGK